MRELFIFISQDTVNTYNTRPRLDQKSFSYNGSQLWNSLPVTFSENIELSHFKTE